MSVKDLEEIRALLVQILQNQAIIIDQIMWLNQQPKAKEEHQLAPQSTSIGIKRKMWLPLEEDEERMKFTGFIRKVQLGGVVDNDGEPPGCKRVKKVDKKMGGGVLQ
jgi:hypothetical protein